MRVDLLDPPAYSPPYDHALAVALARAGAEVRLITGPFRHGTAPVPDGYLREERFGARGIGAPGSRLSGLTRRAGHLPDLLAYRRRPDLPDVVHLQWELLGDLVLAPRRPLVVTLHDPHGISRRLDRADAIIVHTAHARATLARRLAPERIHVVHHGPLEALAPPGPLPPELPPRDGSPVVLFFGLLRPYKGLAPLLAAWRAVHGAQLWIVGRPMQRLPALPAGVGLVPRYVTPAEQAALFQTADLVVLPYLESERFGFSGVLASALAAGRPTVVSDLPGFAEVIATGAVSAVAPGDPAALAAELQRLLDAPELRHRLGAAAARVAAEEFSWPAAATRTLDIYRTVMEG